MGRGRQKAKQTKVARQLKYFSPNTDYTALQRELAGSGDSARVDGEHEDQNPDLDDDAYDDDDGFAAGSGRGR